MTDAFPPYSNYQVGAAILASDKRIYTGYNVENSLYVGGIHAEQMAIANMRKNPDATIDKLIIAALEGGMPCGFCRQQVKDASTDITRIYAVNMKGDVDIFAPWDLLPRPLTQVPIDKSDRTERIMIEDAWNRLERSYIPYSSKAHTCHPPNVSGCPEEMVKNPMASGVTVLTEDRRIFSGTRVEDVIWEGQHAICNALAEMRSQGCETPIEKVVIAQQMPVSDYEPCGLCLQKMVEFVGPDFPDKKDVEIVMLLNKESDFYLRGWLSKLLPHAFNPACLKE
jgi:cytidine deaminase